LIAPAHVVHGPVIHAEVFDHPAAPAVALDVQAHPRALAGDVAHHHVADAPDISLPRRHRGGPVCTITMVTVTFRWTVDPQPVGILPGFEDYGVVAIIEVALAIRTSLRNRPRCRR